MHPGSCSIVEIPAVSGLVLDRGDPGGRAGREHVHKSLGDAGSRRDRGDFGGDVDDLRFAAGLEEDFFTEIGHRGYGNQLLRVGKTL